MQVTLNEYDAIRHEVFQALRVPRKWADKITKIDWRDSEGNFHAEVSAWVTNYAPGYRGDVLIVANGYTKANGEVVPAEAVGLVELYAVKPGSQLTAQERKEAAWDGDTPFGKGTALLFRDPRRVVELPCKMTRDWGRVVYTRGEITPYPRVLSFGKNFWRKLWKRK